MANLVLSTAIKYRPHAVPLISHPWVANLKELYQNHFNTLWHDIGLNLSTYTDRGTAHSQPLFSACKWIIWAASSFTQVHLHLLCVDHSSLHFLAQILLHVSASLPHLRPPEDERKGSCLCSEWCPLLEPFRICASRRAQTISTGLTLTELFKVWALHKSVGAKEREEWCAPSPGIPRWYAAWDPISSTSSLPGPTRGIQHLAATWAGSNSAAGGFSFGCVAWLPPSPPPPASCKTS